VISRVAQFLSFDVQHRSRHLMTSVLTSVSRALDREFTATNRTDLDDAYQAELFGIYLILGALPGSGPDHLYVLRGSTGGLTDEHTVYLDLSPHVASTLAIGGAGRWESPPQT
jgi:hypothetical protein